MTARPTNQPTVMKVYREITLPIKSEMAYVTLSVRVWRTLRPDDVLRGVGVVTLLEPLHQHLVLPFLLLQLGPMLPIIQYIKNYVKWDESSEKQMKPLSCLPPLSLKYPRCF